MNYQAAQKYIFDRLEKELSADLSYHGIHHTVDVITSADLISNHEKLTNQEIILVKTAALYHDVGFIFQYNNNEKLAIDLAQQTLPGFGYSSQEIEVISGMIEATIIAVKPRTNLEKIMIDADFDYFGRNDFSEIAANLFQELKNYDVAYSDKKWDELQVQFLQKHTYYTNFSIENRLAKKQKNLSKLMERFSKY